MKNKMNPYEELGLSRSATDDEIRQRYKSLAQEHHPDRGGDEEKFKRIKRAYEILSDPQTRQEYDTTGNVNNVRTARSCAIEDICHLARNLIYNINAETDDLVVMMRNRVRGFRANITNNINSCKATIDKLQKVVDRIKRKDSGENMIRSITEDQLKWMQGQLIELNKQIEVNDEMLNILEDYHYSKEEWTLRLEDGAASGNRTRDISLED